MGSWKRLRCCLSRFEIAIICTAWQQVSLHLFHRAAQHDKRRDSKQVKHEVSANACYSVTDLLEAQGLTTGSARSKHCMDCRWYPPSSFCTCSCCCAALSRCRSRHGALRSSQLCSIFTASKWDSAHVDTHNRQSSAERQYRLFEPRKKEKLEMHFHHLDVLAERRPTCRLP